MKSPVKPVVLSNPIQSVKPGPSTAPLASPSNTSTTLIPPVSTTKTTPVTVEAQIEVPANYPHDFVTTEDTTNNEEKSSPK